MDESEDRSFSIDPGLPILPDLASQIWVGFVPASYAAYNPDYQLQIIDQNIVRIGRLV